MKKRLLILTASAVILTSSCKKEIEEEKPVDPVKLEYSNLSVEDHKKTLEKNGTDFITSINTLPDEKFISVLKYFFQLDGDVPTYTLPFSSLFSVYGSAQTGNLYGIFNAVITPNTKNLSEYYATYTWDFTQKKWAKTASSNKLEIRFPSNKDSKTNNAVLSFTYTPSNITSTIEGQKYNLPSNTTVSLTVDNKEEVKFISDYAYKSDGNPTKVDIKLAMGSFNLNVGVSSDVKNVTSSVTLTKGNTSLLSLKTEGNGNADVNSIINATKVDGILDKANATFEIMNIKLVGVVDSKSITTEQAAIFNLTGEAKNIKNVDILNKYTSIYAAYKNENAIIAKVAFAPITDTYTYSYWDGTKIVNYSYSRYTNEPRLVFKDGSKLSLEVFTDTGFSKLITELENYGKRFE